MKLSFDNFKIKRNFLTNTTVILTSVITTTGPRIFSHDLHSRLKHTRWSKCLFLASIRKYPNNRSATNTTFWESTSVYRFDRMTARENYFLHRGFMHRRFVDGVQSESLKNHSLRTRNDNDLSQGSRSRRQEVSWLMTSPPLSPP